MPLSSDVVVVTDSFAWQEFLSTLDWAGVAKLAGHDYEEHFDDQYRIIPLNLALSTEEFSMLRDGHESYDMSDKWDLVFYNDMLFCFRSWNGNCVYIVRFAPTTNGYRICDVVENCHPDQWDGHETTTTTGSGWALGLVDWLVGRGRFKWLEDDITKWIWHEPRQAPALLDEA